MEVKQGVLYGVGVGPGDPELMTVRACRTLAACPVIACPRTRQGHMLALEIAGAAVPLAGKELLPLDFAMTRDPAARQACYDRAAETLISRLAAGRDIALLTLGDVSVYSTFAYLAAPAAARGYAVELIPGVTSFSAAAARLGLSLTEMDKPLRILPAGMEGLEQELDRPGTKVLMKAGSASPRTLALLRERGLLQKTALVTDCGLPGERVFPDLTDPPEDIGYFAVFIVKE